MEFDATRMCELLVGLPDVEVLGVERPEPGSLIVMIAPVESRPSCQRCGTAAWVKDRRTADLTDLPAFDQRARPMGPGWSRRSPAGSSVRW